MSDIMPCQITHGKQFRTVKAHRVQTNKKIIKKRNKIGIGKKNLMNIKT